MQLPETARWKSVQAALEAEALEALERGDSVEDSERSLVSEDLDLMVPNSGVKERISLHETRLRRSLDQEIQAEMEDVRSPKQSPIDFFSHVNPDCFNVDGRPLGQPRWHPPRDGDARRRPHVPLDRDFDSPSEEEEDEEEHVDEEVRRVTKVPRKRADLKEADLGSRGSRPFEKVEVTQSYGAATAMQMGQVQLQERPREAQLALPPPQTCPCHGPYCCIDHCRNLAGHCSTLLEGLRHWRTARDVTKPKQAPRGPYKLDNEDPAVEELRVTRERQLTMGILEQNRTRARQRAS